MAAIHFFLPGFEDQVSGVRKEDRESGNPKSVEGPACSEAKVGSTVLLKRRTPHT